MNPMQALLNAFVYRRWRSGGSRLAIMSVLNRNIWRKTHKSKSEEHSPLLVSEPTRLQLSPLASTSSINNYATI